MNVTLSAEHALLVRAALPPGVPATASPPAAPVDWPALLQLAQWHRLLPLLWRYVGDGGTEMGPPPPVEGHLRAASRHTAVRSLLLRAERDRVLTMLDAAGIPAMLLKGSALVELVYPEPSLRPMSDIDVLVPWSLVRRAHGAIEAQGFQVAGVSLGRDDDHRLATHHHHYGLVSPAGVSVEVHHHIVEPGRAFDIGEFWTRAVPGTRGPPHLVPSPEDLFLHGAIHFVRDRLGRRPCSLGQLADLAWISATWPLDWAELGRRAVAYGQRDSLFLALLAMRGLFGDMVPAGLVADLQRRSYTPRLGAQFVEQRVLRAQPGFPLEHLSKVRGRLFHGLEGLDGFAHEHRGRRPTVGRMQFRRAVASARGLWRAARSPRAFRDDVRLSLWIMSLRAGATGPPEEAARRGRGGR